MRKPPVYKEGLIPALHPSVLEVLPLTRQELRSARVFALPAEIRSSERSSNIGCFAVAEVAHPEEWATILPGQPILYTERYTFPEEEYQPGTTALTTRLGYLEHYDTGRKLFAATYQQDGESRELILTAAQVVNVWRVSRFINL